MKKQTLKTVVSVILAVLLLAVLLISCGEGEDASGTNNQTAGVDESDIVKVTGDGYIYKAQSDGVTVSRANPGNGTVSLVAQQSYPDFIPWEMFVTDDYLIVIGSRYATDTIAGEVVSYRKTGEVRFYGLAALKADDAEPLIRYTRFFSEIYTARLYGNQLYLVFRVDSHTSAEKNLVNRCVDSIGGAQSFETFDIINPTFSSRKGFILAKFDLGHLETGSVAAKLYNNQKLSDIYVSPYAIYAISYGYTQTRGFLVSCSSENSHNTLSKISLEDLTVQKQIDVKGTILNRYSLYDNGTILYAVVSDYSTAVYAYASNLIQKSKTVGFAANERVYAARFTEDGFCYVVTFRQVDPLFKIDISQPFNMRLLGELKIDGYSTFLQPFGTDLMMGVGFATDMRWSDETTGVKLSLFDTAGDAPREIESVLFGDSSSSEATRNPHAVLCEPQNNLFAFAVEFRELRDIYTKQGVAVYGVSAEGALERRAFLTNFAVGESVATPKKITRLARIGNYLYAVSDGYITVFDSDFNWLQTLDTRI